MANDEFSNDEFSSDGGTSGAGTGGAVDLSVFDGDFEGAEVKDRSGPPDNTYQVCVDRFEIKKTKEGDKPMFCWGLRVLGPTHAGQFIWRNNVITQKSLPYIKTDLHTCGLKVTKLSEVPAHREELIGIKLQVTKKTTKTKKEGKEHENVNVYFNKRLADEDVATVGADDFNEF